MTAPILTDATRLIESQYTVADLEERILQALAATGADPDRLAVDDLAAVDEFHVRGRQSTIELLAMAQVEQSAHVLDVGCGIGGTARFLAQQAGCRVTGVDLTSEYCRVATSLSDRVGLGESTTFIHADALDLPFDDATFDYVWTEHVQMNIADKLGFYSGIARVLRPGGRLFFHDIFAGDEEPNYPVPWASHQGISHLVAPDAARGAIEEAGLVVEQWIDSTPKAAGWADVVRGKLESGGLPPLSIELHLGPQADTILRNITGGFAEGNLRTIQAVARKV